MDCGKLNAGVKFSALEQIAYGYLLDYMEDYEVTMPFQSLQALGCHVDTGTKCTAYPAVKA
ncbi:hypothetical protein Lal_00031150 [Lupinus albus]|nr:hypothetical protein Lal_00031150 [Lupinus albus]